MMKTLTVSLGERSYPIYIGQNILEQVTALLQRESVRGVVGLVTDSNVGPLYADRVMKCIEASGLRCVTYEIPAGEPNKRLSEIEEMCGAFLEGGLDRASVLIALGGGVVGDMTGFAASVFMRGIPFLQIPTTIVAQVDSSVGGKTGVNHPLGKNTIGAFHQPRGVVIDMTLLRTLPDRELYAGMAEVIKHGVIADAALFSYLESHVDAILNKDLDALVTPVLRSCEIKASVVAQDEKEQGLRAILNYGHTFGHAIEAVSQYSRFLHGEAVALGMCAAGELAHALDMVDADFVARQRACCAAYQLPVSWSELPVEEAVKAMQKDKKARAGVLNFILAEQMGRVVQRKDITHAKAAAAFAAIACE